MILEAKPKSGFTVVERQKLLDINFSSINSRSVPSVLFGQPRGVTEWSIDVTIPESHWIHELVVTTI